MRKVCNSGMKCYFCTRNGEEVHLIYWEGKKVIKRLKKDLAEKKLGFTFAVRKSDKVL
jgi:hypothetical protein